MIRITPQHIYSLRNSTGKPFTDLLDRLIRSSAAILGIPPSDVLDNPRINYPDGGVDTQVNKGAQEGPWAYFKGPTTWQYKAVELEELTDSRVRNEISGSSKDYVRSLLKDGYAFPAAWEAVLPVIAAVELRRRCERLRVWALQKIPFQGNEKEQREARAVVNRVLEQSSSQESEMSVQDKLVAALEPALAAIARRRDEENRQQRIAGLLSSARPYVSTYLRELYNMGDLDYEAICDWEWGRDMEQSVLTELPKQLSGDESNERLRKLVQRILDKELEETGDDE